MTKGHDYVARVSKEKTRIARELSKGALICVRKEHKAEYQAAMIAVEYGNAKIELDAGNTIYIRRSNEITPKPKKGRLFGKPITQF